MARPKPINFALWAAAVAIAYGIVLKDDNEPWDGWDYMIVLVGTWAVRRGAAEYL